MATDNRDDRFSWGAGQVKWINKPDVAKRKNSNSIKKEEEDTMATKELSASTGYFNQEMLEILNRGEADAQTKDDSKSKSEESAKERKQEGSQSPESK